MQTFRTAGFIVCNSAPDPFRLSVEPTQKPECVPIFYAGVVKRAIRNAFMAIEFDKADTLYTTVNRWYLAENFAALRQYWCEHHRSAGKKQIKTLLHLHTTLPRHI